MTVPVYQVCIDWDSDGGLLLADFERDTEDWTGAAVLPVSNPPVARSTVRAYHGDASLLVSWQAGSGIQLVQPHPMGTFTVGRSYTFTAMVWVPTGSVSMAPAVAGLILGSASTVTDAWTEISVTFTATSATHLPQIWAATSPTGGQQGWIDYVRLRMAGEDVTSRNPSVGSTISIQYGRDSARSLSPVAPGTASLELDNDSKDYSPEYASSPLAGFLGPGRDLTIGAVVAGKAHTLYRGRLDDYVTDTRRGEPRVRFTAKDGLSGLKDRAVSTALYPAVRTGEALHRVLDAIGWTGGRDIDPGATTLRWWWAQSNDCSDVVAKIVAAEGPSAMAHIGVGGEFIFRDRHHRLTRAASTTVQGSFSDADQTGGVVETEPSPTIDHGWRDMVNRVTVSVTDRLPSTDPVKIWEDPTAYTLSAGQSRSITIVTDDPFYDLTPPTQGTPATIVDDDPDFVVVSGTVSVAFNRTSGQSATMVVTAVTTANIAAMRLRAHTVKATSTAVEVTREDAASIRKTGGVRPHSPATPWLNREDAGAVADIVLGQRADRLPVITFQVINGTPEALHEQVTRDLSDRIHVTDSQSGFDADCYLEQIKHQISDNGQRLTTTFVAEKIPVLPGNLFMFDTAGRGFDDGVFAGSGVDDPATVFLFDTAGHGFDQGLFAS